MTARQRQSLDFDFNDNPGDYAFTSMYNQSDVTGGLLFICPKGKVHSVHFDCVSHDPGPVWHWDGNRERPTLTPSIKCDDSCCGWHGYLRNGEWVTA